MVGEIKKRLANGENSEGGWEMKNLLKESSRKLYYGVVFDYKVGLGLGILKLFNWCSGYHVCLTHRRSQVQTLD
jgi:hypothetical protein